MSFKSFHSKSASILVSVFIGIIILSFLFTGYYTGSGQSTPDTVAVIDGQTISLGEYRRMLAQRLEFFAKVLRVDSLTDKQMEDFNIKQTVINSLIDQKLLVSYARELQMLPTDEEVRQEIANQDVFHTAGQFDVNLYRSILQANSFSTAQYESMMREQLTYTKMMTMLSSLPISKTYVQDRLQLKKDGITVDALQISKSALAQAVPVTDAEITQFLGDKSNQKKLETYFLSKKNALDQEEQVQLRHILLRTSEDGSNAAEVEARATALAKELTPQNFAAMATKHTEDPSGKENGGFIPWFGKGRMVPEFEKVAFSATAGSIPAPFKSMFGWHILFVEGKKEAKAATLKEFERQLAKEILQKDNLPAQEKIKAELAIKIKALLSAGASQELAALEKEYQGKFLEKKLVNSIDNNLALFNLSNDNLDLLFSKTTDKPLIQQFEDASTLTIIQSVKPAGPIPVPTAEEIDEEYKMIKSALISEYQTEILTKLRKEKSIKVFTKML